ncbi:mitochondrial outer membrane protein SLC25A46-like [Schistocerca serialis cubense]|uniref:mitochondrial outer membrane protein SLC25A46-like n=1 Tax=Schistocerca serialis cubense TaxID=2023355 RepID=UPI00214F1C71|nr:mitochondrial outer membrane protein SLC25A46-like [Schistocerca serialis cubense]
MAGLERYPILPDDSQRTWERIYESAESNNEFRNLAHDISQPAERFKPARPTSFPDDDVAVRKYIGAGVGLASLITENLLSHPFVVLRRQCQVHNNSVRYHLLPVTLLPVMVHLHQRQGFTTLWKGLGSALLVRGMTLAVEDIISKVTPWPKEITWNSSLKSIGQHILLKCVSLAVVTPFYSASLVETVQSDIASEKPGVLDVFREGFCRLLSWSAPQKGRMLPVWALVVPTVAYGLFRYFFTLIVRGTTSRLLHISHKYEQRKQVSLSREVTTQAASQDIELHAALFAVFAADVVFFPLETILHRLHLQGTRTIIDNLDTGLEVMPILTNYEGAADCYRATLEQEGTIGLYKGFGALLLQYAAHLAVVRLTKITLTRLSVLFPRQPPRQSPPPENPVTTGRGSSHSYAGSFRQ